MTSCSKLRVDPKRQIKLPPDFLPATGWRVGDTLIWYGKGDGGRARWSLPVQLGSATRISRCSHFGVSGPHVGKRE